MRPVKGRILDYAYEGSVTIIDWFESDRRNFHGEWIGGCLGTGVVYTICCLPVGHRGECAV